MFINYKETKINYEYDIKGNILLVFLHGWGCNLNLMKKLSNNFDYNFSKVLIDFPPFGKSDEPNQPWNLDDYCILTQNIINNVIQEAQLNNLNIIRIVLIGHSFGCRVAIKLAEIGKCNNIILISAAGMKPKFNLRRLYKIYKYKFLKKIHSSKADQLGSNDYKLLSSNMKKTFINIINNNLEKSCKNINCKTLILHGNKDLETPLYMAKRINKLIKNSTLIVFKNADHFFFLKNSSKIYFLMKIFLLEEIS